jgi:LuxR family transcriptional regulator, maltose regulon positive regulatory protein
MLAQAAGRIARHDLNERLVAALDRGSLLLVAGAGFGKTTALEDALAARGGAVAWVRCSEAHRDPGRLLEDAIAALRQAVPGVADVLGEQLAAGAEPVDVEAATRLLVGELERLLVDPVTIVFDDAESLADEPSST